jgi:hypothetical protein
MTKLPDDYIDPGMKGKDREILECYYSAELSEGGSADEVILRGLKAVIERFGGQSLGDQ